MLKLSDCKKPNKMVIFPVLPSVDKFRSNQRYKVARWVEKKLLNEESLHFGTCQ
jgi:hypothetical protein